MSVQTQIVNLLRDLQRKYRLAYVFISHDLRVVRALAHDLIVIRQGVVVEQGPADDVFDNPTETYTQALMKAALDNEADESGAVRAEAEEAPGYRRCEAGLVYCRGDYANCPVGVGFQGLDQDRSPGALGDWCGIDYSGNSPVVERKIFLSEL